MGQCSNYLHEGKWKKISSGVLSFSGSPFDGQSFGWLVCFQLVENGAVEFEKYY